MPIHPLVRMARKGTMSLSNVTVAHLTASRSIPSSRPFSSSRLNPVSKPSKRLSNKENERRPKASSIPSTSSTSNLTREDEKQAASLDSFALHSDAASPRIKSTSPPPASVKLTDNRSQQAQKKAQQEVDEIVGRAKGKQPGDTTNNAGNDAKVPKGASLHPAAVEKDRKAMSKASTSADIVDGEVRRGSESKSNSSETPGSGKVAEGIFISNSRDTIETKSQGPASSIETATTAASSSTPLSGSSGSSDGVGGFVPSSPEASADNSDSDGGSGPPAMAQISELGQMRPSISLHPFDTHAFIKRLEEAGFLARRGEDAEKGSSVSATTTFLSTVKRHDPAEAIMEALRHLLITRGERVLDHHISKTEVDNQAYLFTAALSELRTELQVRARNDAAALRSMVTLLQREVDGLNQKMREDTAGMKHDIQVDMNNRKSEAKEEQNTLEQEIQDLNNRFTISISDLK